MTDTLSSRRRPIGRSRRLAIAAAIALALIASLVAARPANGGAYRVAQCHPGPGALHADTAFSRTSNHYRGDSGCGDDEGQGLSVRHDGESTQEGKLGAWTLNAPSGAAIVGLRTAVSGTAKGGHIPELVVGRSGDTETVGRAAGDRHWEDWGGAPASWFAARLRCANGSCGPGREALIAIKRLAVTLSDVAAPALRPLGSLFAAGARRGAQSAGASVTDRGSGVHRLRVEVNDRAVATRTLGCQLSGLTALRTVPCPTRADVELPLDTTQEPFRQGRNEVRVCAFDLAPDGGANRTCARRGLRVDNACPLGGASAPTSLEADVQRRRGGATVRGRVVDSAGSPVGGARTCVATTVALPGAAERVVSTPTTGADGRFSTKLPDGPSREIRVAYWPHPDRALERFARLDVPVRPRLALRPRRGLRNGERVGFRVRLPGPRAGQRAVAIQVRANGRWLDLRTGRTDGRGRYASGYRFRSTTGEQTYRFRALVPKQRGYPYERGRSKSRRVTVVG